MRDKNGSILIEGCTLRSELFKDGTKVIFDGIDTLKHPDSPTGLRGGTTKIDQEFLLNSHWVVVDYPKDTDVSKLKPTQEKCK